MRVCEYKCMGVWLCGVGVWLCGVRVSKCVGAGGMGGGIGVWGV